MAAVRAKGLRQQQSKLSVSAFCRDRGFSDQSFYLTSNDMNTIRSFRVPETKRAMANSGIFDDPVHFDQIRCKNEFSDRLLVMAAQHPVRETGHQQHLELGPVNGHCDG